MPRIRINKKDGTVVDFKQETRPGGSYSNRLEFIGGFAIVTDVWGKKTAIPASEIDLVEEIPDRY